MNALHSDCRRCHFGVNLVKILPHVSSMHEMLWHGLVGRNSGGKDKESDHHPRPPDGCAFGRPFEVGGTENLSPPSAKSMSVSSSSFTPATPSIMMTLLREVERLWLDLESE